MAAISRNRFARVREIGGSVSCVLIFLFLFFGFFFILFLWLSVYIVSHVYTTYASFCS